MPPKRRVAVMFELEMPHKRHADVFAGTQQYAREHRWQTIIDEFAAETLERSETDSLPYDGVIGRANEKLARIALLHGLPVVNVWVSSRACHRLPGVFPDYVAAGRLRAEHLLARGLRRFSVITRNHRAGKLQSDAFCEVIAEAGFDCQTVRLPQHHGLTYAKWQQTEQKILAAMDAWEPPLGLFAIGDDMGRMVAQMCQHRGLRVPQDVAIIAGGNEETICEHARPTLTSLEFGYQRVGYQAAQLLDRLMRERARGMRRHSKEAPPHILLPPEGVVVRESTDFFSVDNPVVADALAFIAANCHRRLRQRDVARAVKTETRTLQLRFRKFLDRPIVAVIRQLRLERAKRELVQSDRTMKEIAQDVGFEDPARMNDAFRRELGITPSEYRRQRQLDRKT